MNHVKHLTTVVFLAASVLIASCTEASQVTHDVAATLETADGTGIARVILTADAAERLGIETVPVRSEQVVRTRVFGAEVVNRPAGTTTGSGWWIRIDLTESEIGTIDPALSGLVFSLDDELDSSGLTARPGSPRTGASDRVLYTVTGGTRVTPGTRVLIELPSAGTERLIGSAYKRRANRPSGYRKCRRQGLSGVRNRTPSPQGRTDYRPVSGSPSDRNFWATRQCISTPMGIAASVKSNSG